MAAAGSRMTRWLASNVSGKRAAAGFASFAQRNFAAFGEAVMRRIIDGDIDAHIRVPAKQSGQTFSLHQNPRNGRPRKYLVPPWQRTGGGPSLRKWPEGCCFE